MAGSDTWFDEVYNNNFKALMEFGLRYCSIVGDTDIFVQEAFLKMLAKQEEIRNYSPLHTSRWLRKTLQNLLKNERRTILNRKTDLWLPADLDLLPAPDSSDELYLPDGLTQNEEQIIRLRYEKDLNIWEIARILNKSESACSAQLCRALKKCEALFKERRAERESKSV